MVIERTYWLQIPDGPKTRITKAAYDAARDYYGVDAGFDTVETWPDDGPVDCEVQHTFTPPFLRYSD